MGVTEASGTCHQLHGTQAVKKAIMVGQPLEAIGTCHNLHGTQAGMTGMTREKTRPEGKCRSVRQEQAILETCFKHNRLTASQKS